MGFLKTANAKIINNNIDFSDWSEITGRNYFNNRTAGKAIKNYDPEKYLLTHCTIIASVNVDPEVEYHITPKTAKFVNNNGDSWESDLLSKVYKTFIGSYNFLEHVQVPSLSKGKVIDAALRKIPLEDDPKEWIYLVDILVATDRKHKSLISKISSGELNTLSMGCHVNYTYCTKCGHKASEESDLCDHVKYHKGSYFTDRTGKKRIIAELCGHKTDPDSVKFIEASWVAIPAFEGAVMRNILSFQQNDKGDESKKKVAQLLEEAYSINPEDRIKSGGQAKAASLNKYSFVSFDNYEVLVDKNTLNTKDYLKLDVPEKKGSWIVPKQYLSDFCQDYPEVVKQNKLANTYVKNSSLFEGLNHLTKYLRSFDSEKNS